jgi:hypothetical protein
VNSKADKTLAQVLKEAISAQLYDLHVCLPARVEKYDAAKQRADIQPLLKKRYKAEEVETELPLITAVPVQWPSAAGGGSFLHLPLKKGDLGMAIFCERSLDGWLQGGGQAVGPQDPRHHDLSDAIFLPGVRPFGSPLAGADPDNAVLQNGQMRIEISPDGKISIAGASEEFLTIVDSVLDHLINAQVMTAIGASPFIASTVAALQDDKARLATIKRV